MYTYIKFKLIGPSVGAKFCYADGQTETDMTKLVVAFRNFAVAPKTILFSRKIQVWYGSSYNGPNCDVSRGATCTVQAAYSVRAEKGTAWRALVFAFQSSVEEVFDMVLISNTDAEHICCEASKKSGRLTEWHGN